MTEFEFLLPIGQKSLQITTEDKRLFRSIQNWYKISRMNSNDCLVRIKIHVTDEDFSSLPIQPQTIWDGNNCYFWGKGCKGEINALNSATLFLNQGTSFQYIELFNRVVCAVQVFLQGGILVHGAGIERDGQGYLFTGHSGAGKTTVCKVSTKCKVLNDDIVLLMPLSSSWKIISTPFTNPTQVKPEMGEAPLKMILELKQANEHSVSEVTNAKAIANLLSHIPVISQSSLHAPMLLSRVTDIIHRTKSAELHFLPDDGFWKII